MSSARCTRHWPRVDAPAPAATRTTGSGLPSTRGPAAVEQLLAAVDDRAVGVANRNRGHLIRRDRDHGFVEQGHALGQLPKVNKATALTNPRQRGQLQIAKALSDFGCLCECLVRRRQRRLEILDRSAIR